MEGIIINFRRGRKTQKTNQMVVTIPDYTKEKAEKLIGKKVIYTCEGKNKKEISGTVSSIHGNKGAFRVVFEKGMPGQAIGRKVRLE